MVNRGSPGASPCQFVLHTKAFPIPITNAKYLVQSIMYSAAGEIERMLRHAVALPVEFIMHNSGMGFKANWVVQR